MYYPIVLILLAIGAVIALSVIVLPRFVVFFTSLNVELPLATRALLRMSSFFATNWLNVVGGIAGIFLFWILVRKSNSGRYFTDKIILKIPIFGNLIRIISLERFTRVLGSLTNAGVTLPEAMSLSSRVMSNSNFSRAISETREAILRGEGLTEPLSKFSVFPKETIQILKVGEQTGQLVSQLVHASTYYAKEVDYKLKNLTSLIEPVVLIFVGGGVGFVAVALISAMYGIYSGSGL
jgi:type IV pilus assembly protein PilC